MYKRSDFSTIPLVNVEDNHTIVRQEPTRMRVRPDLDLGWTNDSGVGTSHRSGTFRHVSSATRLDFDIFDNDGAMLVFVIADTKDGTRGGTSPDGDFVFFSFSNVGRNRSVATVLKGNDIVRECDKQKSVQRLFSLTYH
jgi:hypothetical protein